ncbi:hypothetical protein Dsin_007800 [Dipteronia sinensis]|uniref:Uncharacterized protein n=1 Tax=Dipteronia sinensis TaxID=43782 RepID=A0AAE0B0X3_9ROSI|nr:hypothetical protein Dsin_007800 [Dipteronia sinensis]
MSPSSTSLIEGLDSKDRTKVCESLNDARRFALYHSSLLVPILEKVKVVVVKSMKNPRSSLRKTSIMASSDIFKAFGDQLLYSNSDALDSLLLQLLLKASQDRKFVCEEADRTLKVMEDSITPLPLRTLKKQVDRTQEAVLSSAGPEILGTLGRTIKMRPLILYESENFDYPIPNSL